MVILVCPDGHDIIGTLERLSGTAEIAGHVTRDQHGRLKFEYGGYTEIDWDSQETVTRESLEGGDQDGRDPMFVCSDGASYAGTELVSARQRRTA